MTVVISEASKLSLLKNSLWLVGSEDLVLEVSHLNRLMNHVRNLINSQMIHRYFKNKRNTYVFQIVALYNSETEF